ncbi:hypothetical protein [Actinocrispum wychmicini]|uniref:Uncharacterized protein n=1 Tax=Actinocrispum wychmicini TaxID=1213861 RepID=A0A4R2J822_9PSEU|nr:hypothetical protein [Actinocrispum wychmicini]TCO52628.1 hypothetical protein EV192_112360 [Actinocrispum wychmicini]
MKTLRLPAVAVGGVLTVAGIVLAVLATQVSTDLTKQRSSTCNGLLPMPTSAYVFGWTAVAAALVAVVLLVLGRRAGAWWVITLLVLAVLAFLFAGFVTYTVYGDAPTVRHLCSG